MGIFILGGGCCPACGSVVAVSFDTAEVSCHAHCGWRDTSVGVPQKGAKSITLTVVGEQK